MKSRFILVLLLGALAIGIGLAFKFLEMNGANQILMAGIFVEAIVGALYVLQITKRQAE